MKSTDSYDLCIHFLNFKNELKALILIKIFEITYKSTSCLKF